MHELLDIETLLILKVIVRVLGRNLPCAVRSGSVLSEILLATVQRTPQTCDHIKADDKNNGYKCSITPTVLISRIDLD